MIRNSWKLTQLTIELLNQCAQSCIFCSSMSLASDVTTCLSLNEVKTVLQEAKELGAEKVAFSGGEPLLYGDLGTCLMYARQLGMDTYLYTSGIMTGVDGNRISISTSEIELLKAAQVQQVYLSIHGASAETHDTLCGKSNSYILALESLRLMLLSGLKVGVHFLVTHINYNDISPAATNLFDLGINDLKLMRLVSQGRAASNKEDLQITLEDQKCILGHISFLHEKYKDRITLGCFWGRTFPALTPDCKVGQSVLTVKANGDIVPCGANKFLPVGNIRQSRLSEIWLKSTRLERLASHNGPVCDAPKSKRTESIF